MRFSGSIGGLVRGGLRGMIIKGGIERWKGQLRLDFGLNWEIDS